MTTWTILLLIFYGQSVSPFELTAKYYSEADCQSAAVQLHRAVDDNVQDVTLHTVTVCVPHPKKGKLR